MSKKNEELLDQIFNDIASGIFDSETTAQFQKRIQETFTKSGYASVGELINHGVDTVSKYVGPNAQYSGFDKPLEINNGFTFVQNELSMIRYDMRKRGAFRDGHQEALRLYYQQMISHKTHIQSLVPIIQEELVRRKESMPKRDRYGEGYIAGLEDLLRILDDAKKYMMNKVLNSLI